ncbi:beta-1,6-N-acetylglucosaminyltransferase [Chitinophaga sp. LS1]|uniref:beta-1,6-N-acetylglucosaminyltransferase n=1 Tax=Chitinophaga sp. LS1 TaxID=3051176 RepID=UPI002AAA972D|nr:beta-1,6-N-acetylglucosaminyltransferase [Chitinophaga sp. LS1]WPV65516.1 beta-1,6-N-acetylglucosaminyltransferase [Chitinophaga sp. LS1]
MRIAYLITAYRDFDHLSRLIEKILTPETEIFVHIDAKIEYNLSIALKDNDRVHILEDRFLVTWGGFNLTLAFMALMSECRASGTYDQVFLISGADFPLVSNDEISAFVAANKDLIFLEYFEIPYAKWTGSNGGIDRYELEWPVDDIGKDTAEEYAWQQKEAGIRRAFPAGLKPYGGSCWWTMPSAVLEYLCDYFTDNFDWIYPYFRTVLLADEILIPTVIMNSPYKRKVINNNLRYIDWVTGPASPKILTMDDLPLLKASGCLFARKFIPAIDSEVIDQLEQSIMLT